MHPSFHKLVQARRMLSLAQVVLGRDIKNIKKIDPNILQKVEQEWEQEKTYFLQLRETKRNKVSLSSLGLTPNGGADNIRKVFALATPDEIGFWKHWYHDASGEVHRVADERGFPLPLVAALVAVLSPGNKWWLNIRAASRMLKFWKLSVIPPKVEAYPNQMKKAIYILQKYDETGEVDISPLETPKVGIFYNSLVDPEGTKRDIVLDGHAINIYKGVKDRLKGMADPTTEEKSAMKDAYREVASEVGVDPQELQAITWYLWKFVTK